jgi:hypothetical protein
MFISEFLLTYVIPGQNLPYRCSWLLLCVCFWLQMVLEEHVALFIGFVVEAETVSKMFDITSILITNHPHESLKCHVIVHRKLP